VTDPSDEAVRDSSVRVAVSESERIKVWAKAAGRCVICSEYLVGETSFLHTTLVGEVAHNIGATNGTGSPRGNSDLDLPSRALESNLLLLCHTCHRKVDSRGLAEHYSQDMLAALKKKHESRVRSVTNFATHAPTFVLRVGSSVRGSFARASDRQVAEAFRLSGLTHGTDDSRDATVEIDLPDPETWETTWDRTKQIVSTQVDKVRRDSSLAGVDTISVFAIGPIPTLVYLGYQLDDKTSVKVFAPSRRDDDSRWMWSEITDSTPEFVTSITHGNSGAATEILLTVGITAPVRLDELPPGLAAMPRVEVTPEGAFGPNVLSTYNALESFGTAWRAVFAQVEAAFPRLETIHLAAVVPAVGAIEIGRAYMRGAQPNVIVYQRQREKFVPAITLE
jgi:hypothetical protein